MITPLSAAEADALREANVCTIHGAAADRSPLRGQDRTGRNDFRTEFERDAR